MYEKQFPLHAKLGKNRYGQKNLRIKLKFALVEKYFSGQLIIKVNIETTLRHKQWCNSECNFLSISKRGGICCTIYSTYPIFVAGMDTLINHNQSNLLIKQKYFQLTQYD